MKKTLFKTILLPVVILLLTGCVKGKLDSKEILPNETYNYKEYKEYTYIFDDKESEFMYPKEEWIIEEIPSWKSSEGLEASPEWGVKVYRQGDKDNYLDLFASFSQGRVETMESDYIEKDFMVDGTKIGRLYIKLEDEIVYINVLYQEGDYEGFHNSSAKTSEKFYEDNKDIIWHILASMN